MQRHNLKHPLPAHYPPKHFNPQYYASQAIQNFSSPPPLRPKSRSGGIKKGIDLTKNFKKTFSSLYSGIQLQDQKKQQRHPPVRVNRSLVKHKPKRYQIQRPKSVQSFPFPQPLRYHTPPPLSPRLIRPLSIITLKLPSQTHLPPPPSNSYIPSNIQSQSTDKNSYSTQHSQINKYVSQRRESQNESVRMSSFLDVSGYALVSNILKESEGDKGSRVSLGKAKEVESILMWENSINEYYRGRDGGEKRKAEGGGKI